jgi:hypothetical protein
MATESQIAANRQNAQSSTGPTTEPGKAASSRNAVTLGLYTRADYVRPEEHDLYIEFCETLGAELSPEGLLETTFADEIAEATWRLRRCSAAEAGLGEFDEATDKTRRSIERARSHAHSMLHRSVNQLRRLQTERTCRAVLNAAGDDAGLADYQHVVVAANDYERGKHLHAKSCEITMNTKLASICKTPAPPSARAESACAPARNALCPCNSGQKYKNCCARQGPGWPSPIPAAAPAQGKAA